MSNQKDRTYEQHMKRRGRVRMVILIIVILAAIAVVSVLWVFTTNTVHVKGNTLYSEKQVEKDLLSQKHAKSSLYLYLAYKTGRGRIPEYAQNVKVTMETPHELNVTITEKPVVCYLYSLRNDSYVYVDEKGEALLISKEQLSGIPKAGGITLDTIRLYKRVTKKETSLFRYIQAAQQLLTKYDMVPKQYYVADDTNLILDYGKIQVSLGTNQYLNEKIVRAKKLMKKLKRKSGTLHLETWTQETTDVYFRKKELIKIPADEVRKP